MRKITMNDYRTGSKAWCIIAFVLCGSVRPAVQIASAQAQAVVVSENGVEIKNNIGGGPNNMVRGNAIKRTIPANNKAITVDGNKNILTVTGKCPRLIMNGNNNTVYIDSVEVIQFNGNNNAVYYKKGTTTGTKPKIAMLGNGNKAIVRGSK